MTTVSIIGTAGREQQLSPELYVKMLAEAKRIICQYENVELVSGGAAWADHLAVTLHLQHGIPLTLHLPARWDHGTKKYFDNGKPGWDLNPGATANYYHQKFAHTMGRFDDESLRTIDELIAKQAINITVSRGFHARNRKVAASDVVIAFTFGDTCPPPKGGTAHTWGLVKGERIHVSLNNLR